MRIPRRLEAYVPITAEERLHFSFCVTHHEPWAAEGPRLERLLGVIIQTLLIRRTVRIAEDVFDLAFAETFRENLTQQLGLADI